MRLAKFECTLQSLHAPKKITRYFIHDYMHHHSSTDGAQWAYEFWGDDGKERNITIHLMKHEIKIVILAIGGEIKCRNTFCVSPH